MNVYELRDLSMLIGLCLLPAAAVASWLFWTRPGMSGRRLRLIAAAPLPIAITCLCLWVIVDASFLSSEKECGVDACGMAAMFAVIGIAYAATACVISYGVVWLFTRSRR